MSRSTRQPLDFEVLVEPSGDWACGEEPEQVVVAARELLEQARASGHRSPHANFYAKGVCVRYGMLRTELTALDRKCWCGRGALKIVDDFGFCSDQHRALWDRLDPQTKARVSVLQFISQYSSGRKGGG